jgi:hypothetical protein
MCLPGRVIVVGSKVPFRYGVGGRQLSALLVGGWWLSVICLSGRGLVVVGYLPF